MSNVPEWYQRFLDVVERHLITCRIAINHENPEQAISVLDNTMVALQEYFHDQINVVVDSHVSEIFDLKTANMLERGGIQTIGSLCLCKASDIRAIRNANQTTVDYISLVLSSHGLKLSEE